MFGADPGNIIQRERGGMNLGYYGKNHISSDY